jgi:hypothetical protein
VWSIVTGICTFIGGLLGLLTTTNPKLIEPPRKSWFVAAFSLVLLVGVFSAWMDQREGTQEAEDALRQVTGRGGFPTVTVIGDDSAGAQTAEGSVRGHFLIMNDSKVPVFDCRIQVMQLVGAPYGFRGSDSLIFETASVASVHPHDAPIWLPLQPALRLDVPNIFSVTIFSRAATFSERVVVLWKDGAWHVDTQVVQLWDPDRNNKETILKTMDPKLRAMLPEAWRE